jgi:hypothetical protein
MNWRRETVKMDVPAPIARLRRTQARRAGTAISAVAVTPGREFMKYPGQVDSK